MNIFKIGYAISFCILCLCSALVYQQTEVKHKIFVKHPGISLTEKVERTLVEVRNEAGRAEEFYMEVETVVCGDARCKIDIVRVYWDKFGFYSRLELPLNVELEKAEGKRFDKSDYEKLDFILSNRYASLKEVYKEEVVGTETSEGIDAISGATIILNTNDYVKGAVWTCYTLWHWVNSEVFSIIRDISGKQLTNDELLAFLKKEKIPCKIFALEELTDRQNDQPETLQLVLEQAATNDYELLKLMMRYLEHSTTETYGTSMISLIQNGNHQQRNLCLNSISVSDHQLNEGFFESISKKLHAWNDYPSINLFLNLLDKRTTSSPSLIQAIFQLLDRKNFIIARRAYWFLQEQALTKEQQSKLKAFFRKHEESL